MLWEFRISPLRMPPVNETAKNKKEKQCLEKIDYMVKTVYVSLELEMHRISMSRLTTILHQKCML